MRRPGTLDTDPAGGTPHARLDITREVCPMTFVRTKLALEALAPGALLEVRLAGDEPLRNVPASARDDGHAIVSLTERGDGTWTLLVRKRPAC